MTAATTVRAPASTPRPSRPGALVLLFAVGAASLVACGGPGTGAGSSADTTSADTTSADATSADTTAPTASADTTTADTTTADTTIADPTIADTADAGPAESGPSEEWSIEARSVKSPAEGRRRSALLVSARAASHDGYDRFVLEFEDRVPDYTIRYPDEPLRQCGSGRPVEVASAAALHIRLNPADAHDEQGRTTVTPRSMEPRLRILRSARLICDFEGTVEWVLGVERRAPFRVFTLDSPGRLVVDLRR